MACKLASVGPTAPAAGMRLSSTYWHEKNMTFIWLPLWPKLCQWAWLYSKIRGCNEYLCSYLLKSLIKWGLLRNQGARVKLNNAIGYSVTTAKTKVRGGQSVSSSVFEEGHATLTLILYLWWVVPGFVWVVLSFQIFLCDYIPSHGLKQLL